MKKKYNQSSFDFVLARKRRRGENDCRKQK